MREVLIIFKEVESLTTAKAKLPVKIRHVLSPRVFLVKPPGNDREHNALIALADLFDVYETQPPDRVMNHLEPSERLGVAAWLERQRPKSRRNSGIPWDAKGYSPPDRISR